MARQAMLLLAVAAASASAFAPPSGPPPPPLLSKAHHLGARGVSSRHRHHHARPWVLAASGDGGGSEDEREKEEADDSLQRKIRFPPQVDDVVLLFGDVVAIFAVAQTLALCRVLLDPSFPGWFAPVILPSDPGSTLGATVTEGSRLAVCWLVAGSVCNSWVFGAVVGLQNAVYCAARTTLDTVNTLAVSVLVDAALRHQPVDLSKLFAEALLTLIIMGAWRAAYASSLYR